MRPEQKYGLAAIAVVAAALITGACGAKEVTMPDAASMSIQDVFGHWRLSGADTPSACRLTLDPVAEAGRLSASFTHCAPSTLASATTWRTTAEGFDLLGKGDEVRVRFRRIDVDHFEGRDADGAVYHLVRAPMA